MKGLLGRSSFSSAITRPEDESRAARTPPINVLLCMLVGSCPFPDLLWLTKAWLVIIEPVLSFFYRDFYWHPRFAPSKILHPNASACFGLRFFVPSASDIRDRHIEFRSA